MKYGSVYYIIGVETNAREVATHIVGEDVEDAIKNFKKLTADRKQWIVQIRKADFIMSGVVIP